MHGATPFETYAIWAVLVIAIVGLLYALFLRRQVLRHDKGSDKMQEVWNAIRVGADAYLNRQLKTILPLIVILTVALFFSVYVVKPSPEAMERFAGMAEDRIKLIVGLARAIAFIMGSFFSLMVGQFGMRMAVQGNVRVASAARSSFDKAVKIAYRSGTITGMLTDGLGLFGGTIIFIIMGKAAPDALLGFGFGGTLLALFMRVGGGIFTKAADVGADLVGKVEAGIPEDDPRNAAVIADQVGDNVGDCAGMAADIFESYEVTIVSGLILGLALVAITGELKWIVFPLLVRGIGVFASIVGTYLVRGGKSVKGNAMTAINRGFYTSAVISLVSFAFLAHFYMHEWRAFLSVAVGVVLAIVIDEVTKFFTDTHHGPVKGIARQARTGPATIILQGLGVGYESSVYSVLVIAATILAAVGIYTIGFRIAPEVVQRFMDSTGQFGMAPHVAEQMIRTAYILYGVAMTGIGMLTLTGNNVAMDSYGPIVDNANGIGEMSGLEKNARQIMADLDAVGNTTKAITKGVAIGSAVIAAVSLFGSFITDVRKIDPTALTQGIRISEPVIFIGFLIGGALPWLFSSLTISAVSRAASLIVEEVRRQFKIPGLMEGKVPADYRQAVGICTTAAQRELITLALLAVLTPIIIGLALQVEALGGFLAGAILSGQLLAVFMANAGAAWDNAKKSIEDEPSNPAGNTGKGSERHKASVVGDTIGDPLKDTAGPALNPMLKVVNLVSLLAAPIMVAQKAMTPVKAGIIVACIVAVISVVLISRRGTKESQV
ncbi:MAG: sodium-translocating pyrophosphatase [candidate division WOR-3 bacterium]